MTKMNLPAKKSTREATVDGYLAAAPKDARNALEKLRKIIRSAVPDATEAISYGIPAFKYKGRPIVWYAAFKDHCSFFPMNSKLLSAHAAEAMGFSLSKGTIRFSVENPLPASLVKKVVRARMAEIEARGKGYGRRKVEKVKSEKQKAEG